MLYATKTAGRRARWPAKPNPAKPISIIAQVEVSGTDVTEASGADVDVTVKVTKYLLSPNEAPCALKAIEFGVKLTSVGVSPGKFVERENPVTPEPKSKPAYSIPLKDAGL
jgi:hypothetical protein